ncbi:MULTISPECIES: reverse transcriptase-like protein [unclassified Sphingomonas]|uniref:reverse transcriptase-like protein n=1 Tax=unclassified Sphingomonas TaxID=196159 RepID=UPI001E5D50F4|nr:reverse transcriptase-like protein [Sphingomonas sp. FARSPH]
MKLFFDGGLRPAGMETAVVAAGKSHICRALGPGTSMEAEWRALIAAATLAQAEGWDDAVLLGDAAAVIAQATGKVRCPPAYRAHRDALHGMGGRWRIRYVKRTQNLAGIALARLHAR